jgi:hypothetical protein
VHTNRCVRFGFFGATVLVAGSGHQVSLNTTVDGEWQSQAASFDLSMPYFGHMAYFVIGELHDINIIGSNLFSSGRYESIY